MANTNLLKIGDNTPTTLMYGTMKEDDTTVYPSTEEVWDVWYGETPVYHKDKTYENCWKKYLNVTIGTESSNPSGITRTVETISYDSNKLVHLPEIIDNISDYFSSFDPATGSTSKRICFRNLKLDSDSYWTQLIGYLAIQEGIRVEQLRNFLYGCNISGTINISCIDSLQGNYRIENAFRETNLSNVIINMNNQNDAVVVNTSNMFMNCYSLTNFSLMSGRFQSTQAVHMFDNCSQLTSVAIDSILPSYSSDITSTGTGSNCDYMFYKCKSLTDIPSSTTNDNRYVYPRSMVSMFQGCSKLRQIDSIISLKQITTPSLLNQAFAGCQSLALLYLNDLYYRPSSTRTRVLFFDRSEIPESVPSTVNAGAVGDCSSWNFPSQLNLLNFSVNLCSPSYKSQYVHVPTTWTLNDNVIENAYSKGIGIIIGDEWPSNRYVLSYPLLADLRQVCLAQESEYVIYEVTEGQSQFTEPGWYICARDRMVVTTCVMQSDYKVGEVVFMQGQYRAFYINSVQDNTIKLTPKDE